MTDVTGTNGNDTLLFQGEDENLSLTLTNDYSGEQVVVAGTYNVNTATYNGLGGTDTLAMTSQGDALYILDASNNVTLNSVERIVAGDGNDVIALDSATAVIGNINIQGDAGDDILWGNSGNDTILGQDGNDNIDGGPGNDILDGGNGNDTINGGAGNDIVTGDAGDDTLVYILSENIGATDHYDGGTGTDTLVLRLTAAQDNQYASQISLAQAFIAAGSNPNGDTGQSASFTFSFGLTFSNIEALDVVITSNTNPIAKPDNFTDVKNHAVSGNVLADNGHGADSDPDGDALTVAAQTVTTAAGATVVLSANGDFTYTAASGFTGNDSFTYTLQDGRGGTDTGTVSVAVQAAAPIAQADTFVTAENHAVSGNLLADNGHGADSDPNGDTLAVQAATLATANGGQVVVNGDGTFTYTPAAGFTGADSFNYTLVNSDGVQSIGTASIATSAITVSSHSFSAENVLFPNLIETVNIANLVPPGTPALGVIHGDLAVGASLSATVTFDQTGAGYHNTLGSFIVAADGTIENTGILFTDAHQQQTGNTFNINLPAAEGAQLGFFIIANGNTVNNGYSHIDLAHGTLNFYYDYGQFDQRLANIADTGSHLSLVYTSAESQNTVLQGADYFTTDRGGSTAINADGQIHVVAGLTSNTETNDLRIGFEDLKNTGDADYNDVVFDVTFAPAATASVDTANDALVGSAGLYGAAADTFLIDATTPSPEKIVDFKAGSGGDTLDISNILHGYDSLTSLISNFVQETTAGNVATIAVNATGQAGGAFTPVAVIEGLSASLADLVTNGNLILAHHAAT